MNNLDLDSLKSVKLSSINPDHLPVAYAFIGLGLLVLLKSPNKIMSLLGGYMLYRDLVTKGKEKLIEEIDKAKSQ